MADSTDNSARSIAMVIIVLAVIGFIAWLIISGRFPMGNSSPNKNINIKIEMPSIPTPSSNPTPTPAQ